MANQEQLEILNKGVKEWNRWRESNPGIQIDLSDVDLEGRDLPFINLIGADLSRTNLTSANLLCANLHSSRLDFATLRNAKLVWANLSRSTLIDATLHNANLTETNLLEAKVSTDQLKKAESVHPLFLQEVNLDSSNKLKEELNVSSKKIYEREKELQRLQNKTSQITLEQEKQKLELEKEVERLKEELVARAKDSEDFKKRLSKASDDIKTPYTYLTSEIFIENILYSVFILIAVISFCYLCKFICGLNYSDRLLKIYADKDFNFYKLFFIISPVIYYLGICSTFLTLAFNRRQNIQNLQAKRQEINHITGILSAYTTIREDEDIVHAKEFAREAIKNYLNKVMAVKTEIKKEEDENVNLLSSIKDLLNSNYSDLKKIVKDDSKNT